MVYNPCRLHLWLYNYQDRHCIAKIFYLWNLEVIIHPAAGSPVKILPTRKWFGSPMKILRPILPNLRRILALSSPKMTVEPSQLLIICDDPTGFAGHRVKIYVVAHPDMPAVQELKLALYTRLSGKQFISHLKPTVSFCGQTKQTHQCISIIHETDRFI